VSPSTSLAEVTALRPLAVALRQSATRQGLTAMDLAVRTGLSDRHVRRVLSGAVAHLETIAVVAGALGLRLTVVEA
jgi:DNA-binding phage protein